MSDSGSGTVELVFGVKNEQNLKGADQFGVGLEVPFVQLIEHKQEILDISSILVRFVILATDPVTVGIGSDGRHPTQQAINLFIPHFFILVHCLADKRRVLFGVKSGQCGNGTAKHSHGMCIISEGIHHGE